MTTGTIRLTARSHTALRPATAARVTGGFWAERRATNARVSPGNEELASSVLELTALLTAAQDADGYLRTSPIGWPRPSPRTG
ncbi:hypothetical protein [Streptomyces sp. NPDC091212]|uniref:hypothetical protein n=1 Tax=Streptomyces sp. NPDC091212 TaxID=3155191 RepID=UPI003424D80E